MTMTAAQFDDLAARVEATAAAQPRAYRRRLLGMAALGYGYIALALTVLVALAAALVIVPLSGGFEGLAPLAAIQRFAVMALVLPVAITIHSAVRGLFARAAPPEGIELTREQVPVLFEFLDQARAAAHAPAIHRVVLNDDFNASIVQQSRPGLLGWPRNHLVLGLPLLDAMSPDEFRAILAHEIGHLNGWNDHLASQVYELRCTWDIILGTMEQNHLLARLVFLPFFRWYAPRFIAYSSVLVRQHELAADQLAADLVGGRTTADMLVRLRLVREHLCETFWPALYEAATETPDTPRAIFTDLAAAARRGPEAAEQERMLADALVADTDSMDTHPCLRERIAALGQEPRLPAVTEVSASQELLGDALPALRRLMDDTWHAEASEWWQEQYTDARERTARLAELEARTTDTPLTIREQWERATLIEAVRGAEAAVAAFQELVRRQPRSSLAHVHLGRLLFELKRDEGLVMLETALRLNPTNVEQVCELIYGYLSERERPSELAVCQRWLSDIVDRLLRDGDWLFELRHDREYLPHGLTPDELVPIVDAIDGIEQVQEAYLVRFGWPAFPETEIFMLEMVRRPDLTDDQTAIRAIRDQIYFAPEVPSKSLLNVHDRGEGKFHAAVTAVDGALIYQRDHGLGRQERRSERRAA